MSIGVLPNVNFYNTETGCKAGDKCIKDSPGETRCEKFWDQFDEYGSHSPRYVKRVSGKTKDHRLEKYKSKNPHQRSPYAMKFEGRSQEETESQQRCAGGKVWNLAKNIYKLKEKDNATFYSPLEEWVLPAREFVVCSGASMHMVSKKDLNSAELETVTVSKKSDDGDDGQRRGAKKRRSHGLCQRLGLTRDSYASWKTPAVLSLGKLCEDIMSIPTTGPAVKNHISPKIVG